MGIYNIVEYREECQKCGFKIKDWQTKDSTVIVKSESGRHYALDNSFNVLVLEDIREGTMCSECPKCCTFIERSIRKGKVEPIVEPEGEK